MRQARLGCAPLTCLAAGIMMVSGACNRNPDGDGTAGVEGSGGTAVDGADDGSPGTTSTAGTTGADASTGGEGPRPLYDLGTIPDAPPAMGCQGRGGNGGGGPTDGLFSFIWIANSYEGTVSKIDTVTLEEVGRYYTRPSNGDPSRTSVNLNGDVAVANRNGGLVKFYANPARCEDRNGNGMIDTSTGPTDVLPWDEEECRAWYTELNYASNRPVAWTPGQWDPTECRYENTKVWTSGTNDDSWGDKGFPEPGGDGGMGGGGGGGGQFDGIRVLLADGESGEIEAAVKIPEMVSDYYGIYGGAVDSAGNFWGSQLSLGSIVRVNLATLEHQVWPMEVGGYGMTVDSAGHVWTCSQQVGRFDPATETWQTASVGGSGGCMEDGQGTLWLASNSLVGVDIETLQVVANHAIPDYVHGVSIDFQGFVWGVSMGTAAYRVDPITGEYDTVFGLNNPYTYSDMTGFALANAGGWTPAG